MSLTVPMNWHSIHAALVARHNDLPLGTENVPVPLILTGAAFSTAAEIRKRWQETLDWASKHGLMEELLAVYAAPPTGRDYAEEMAGVSASGKGWWPDMTYWNQEPRRKPSVQETSNSLRHLQEHWLDVVGQPLAAATRPLAFTGRKSRRLLVVADPNVLPPWGTWFSCDRAPESFRAFRLAINSQINPLEIDHVDFQLSLSSGGGLKW